MREKAIPRDARGGPGDALYRPKCPDFALFGKVGPTEEGEARFKVITYDVLAHAYTSGKGKDGSYDKRLDRAILASGASVEK